MQKQHLTAISCRVKPIVQPEQRNSPQTVVNSNKWFMPKWARVSDSVKEGRGQNSSGPFPLSLAPQRLMVKACFHWVNVYPSIRKEAHHKQEYRGQHRQENNELLSSSLLPYLGHSQRSLKAWGMCRRVEHTQSSGSLLLSRETWLRTVFKNQRKRINSENIWTIYSNTLWIVLKAGGQRAVVENGRWRYGNNLQAVQWILFCHGLPKWLWFTEGPIDN